MPLTLVCTAPSLTYRLIVYVSWYSCSRSPIEMPKQPTLRAFRRTMTYSFGSISLGSLIVSPIQNAIQGYIIACVLFCILSCILSFIEWAAQYFHHSYIPVAKDTWRMVKDSGFDALINDVLGGSKAIHCKELYVDKCAIIG
ncbi:plasma-membrane choline transporter-domain-containing protein [Tirmania nivea]|nr:plasma-membrane choline transporter-domain-containing protein [Tirmania nivea]